jgi:hypothetical protein
MTSFPDEGKCVFPGNSRLSLALQGKNHPLKNAKSLFNEEMFAQKTVYGGSIAEPEENERTVSVVILDSSNDNKPVKRSGSLTCWIPGQGPRLETWDSGE